MKKVLLFFIFAILTKSMYTQDVKGLTNNQNTNNYEEYDDEPEILSVKYESHYYEHINDESLLVYNIALDTLEKGYENQALDILKSLFDYDEEPTRIGLMTNDVIADIYYNRKDLYGLGICANYTKKYMKKHLWDSEMSQNYATILRYIGDIKNDIMFKDDIMGIWVSDFSIGGEYVPYLMIEITKKNDKYIGRILPGCYLAKKYAIHQGKNSLLSVTNGFQVDLDSLKVHLFFGDNHYSAKSGILAKAATDFTKEISKSMIIKTNLNTEDIWEKQLKATGIELTAAALSTLFELASVSKETDRTIDIVMSKAYNGALISVIIESVYTNWSDGRFEEKHIPFNFMMYKLYPDYDFVFEGYDYKLVSHKMSYKNIVGKDASANEVNMIMRTNKNGQHHSIRKALNKEAYNKLCETKCYDFIHYSENWQNSTETSVRSQFESAIRGALYGEKEYIDGSKYFGMIYADTKNEHGSGKIIYKDGGVFEGNFENGKKNGKGKYIYPNGVDYIINNYDNDVLNGDYVEYFGDTAKIECEFKKGSIVGILKVSKFKGDSIFINFDSHNLYKPIEVRYTNGDKFIGVSDIKMKRLKGIWYNKDGAEVKGLLKNGEKDGLFITNKADGTVIEEKYKKGKKNGISKIKNTDGSIIVETWKNGQKIDK